MLHQPRSRCVAFVIFFIAQLAEGNRTPFDLPEAESELVAGYLVGVLGRSASRIFFLVEFGNLWVMARHRASRSSSAAGRCRSPAPRSSPRRAGAGELPGARLVGLQLASMVVFVREDAARPERRGLDPLDAAPHPRRPDDDALLEVPGPVRVRRVRRRRCSGEILVARVPVAVGRRRAWRSSVAALGGGGLLFAPPDAAEHRRGRATASTSPTGKRSRNDHATDRPRVHRRHPGHGEVLLARAVDHALVPAPAPDDGPVPGPHADAGARHAAAALPRVPRGGHRHLHRAARPASAPARSTASRSRSRRTRRTRSSASSRSSTSTRRSACSAACAWSPAPPAPSSTPASSRARSGNIRNLMFRWSRPARAVPGLQGRQERGVLPARAARLARAREARGARVGRARAGVPAARAARPRAAKPAAQAEAAAAAAGAAPPRRRRPRRRPPRRTASPPRQPGAASSRRRGRSRRRATAAAPAKAPAAEKAARGAAAAEPGRHPEPRDEVRTRP